MGGLSWVHVVTRDLCRRLLLYKHFPLVLKYKLKVVSHSWPYCEPNSCLLQIFFVLTEVLLYSFLCSSVHVVRSISNHP